MASSEREEAMMPLLEKKPEVSLVGCPGCAMDQRKAENPGIPYRLFFHIWIIILVSSLPISLLFPFLYFMTRDLHITKIEEDIGFYAGFVGASYMFGRGLTSSAWGMLADRIGRKPVIILGISFASVHFFLNFSSFGLSYVNQDMHFNYLLLPVFDYYEFMPVYYFYVRIVFNTLFGLSVHYWMALATRFLLGSLNGLLGPIRAYSVEVCRPEHQAIALSLVCTAWAIGLIVGPAIGGYLAQPIKKYPKLFQANSIFGRFPYFLPCLCVSIFCFIVLVSCIWLPETLHKHKLLGKEDQPEIYHIVDSFYSEDSIEQHNNSSDKNKKLYKNWKLMSSIILYCIVCFEDAAYTEIFPLWAESNIKYGGLSFSSEDVGQVLAVAGASILLYQTFLYPHIINIYGPINSSRVASILSVVVLFTYPPMTYLSRPWVSIVISIASTLKSIFAITVITCSFILQNNSVMQDQRASANGLATTLMSFSKAIAPAGAGIVFSWAQKRRDASFLPGDQMVFFLLGIGVLAETIWTFKPFLAVPEQFSSH